MTKKKYHQQSDTVPLSESSVPVSHSDDEGNVVIEQVDSASIPIYEPIPELVELESSSSLPSVQDPGPGPGPGPVSESSPESPDLVPVPVPERVLEPVPEPIAPSQALVADPNAVIGVSEQPLSVLVLDSSSNTNTNTTSTSTTNTTSTSTSTSTSTTNTTSTSTSKWIQFKSWFSKCCRACFSSCCCCCHRRRRSSHASSADTR